MHKLPTHTRNALIVTEKLQKAGIPIPIQQKIGTFAVAWGLFESNLERAVWALKKENVRGNRPSTDKTSAHSWVATLAEGSDELSITANEVLNIAAIAAKDLMNYRHSLFHGYLISLGGTAWFIRNPSLNGEKRNRKVGDAHIEENLIDLAIDAAWLLFSVVIAITRDNNLTTNIKEIESFESEVRRIKNTTNELINIAALMNHEKY